MTAQTKKRILDIISERIRKFGFMKLNQLTPTLEENGFSREIYEGSGPKKWIQANFPEITIDGSNGKETLSVASSSPIPVPTPNPVVTELPADVRRRYADIFTAQLETYGMLLHSSVPSLLPDWQKYRNGNERLGAWLARNFSEEEFCTRIVNNAAALFMPHTAADIDRIIQIFRELVSRKDAVQIGDLSAELTRENLQWQSIPIAHNQTLGEWMLDYCPGSAYADAGETTLCLKQSDPEATPSVTDAIKQSVVHRYVFLPTASSILNSLREMLDNPSFSAAAWRKQAVNVCYNNLLGLGEGFLDDSCSDRPRIAFYTGLQTPEKKHIYCIITPNQLETAAQRWKGESFCYPGQDDPDGNGRWLCQRFGLPSENRDAISGAYQNISEAVDRIEAIRPELLECFDRVYQAIDKGDPIPSGFGDRLSQYSTHWEQILTSVRELGEQIPAGKPALGYVKDLLNQKDNVNAALDAMRADYQILVAQTWKYLDDEAGVLNEDIQEQADLDRWDALFRDSQMSPDEVKSAVQELLAPFLAVRTLTQSELPLTGDARNAWLMAEGHFNADIRIKEVRKYFVEADREALVFLDKIDDINNRLQHLEMNSVSVCRQEMAALDPETVLDQVLNTGSIHLVHQHYPGANEFERAVICSDTVMMQDICGNAEFMAAMGYSAEEHALITETVAKLSCSYSTPVLAAGLNLNRLQGNTNRQAEKYLLLALILKDGNAAEHLMELYFREGSTRLLWLVYNVYGKNLPAEMRQRYLCRLIEDGYVDAEESIQEDIIGFLSIQDTDVMIDICRSGQLQEQHAGHILQIREALEIPFIRQIVFLDSELYRFIQQQENITGIQELGIQHTAETLGDLLRIGSYPRGQDPMSAALRVWYFVKDWNGLAERFAVLAADSAQRDELFWRICQFRGDKTRMLSLLQRNPALRSRNFEIYSDLLFASGAYQEYYDVMADLDETTAHMKLQFIISAIRIGQWDGDVSVEFRENELAHTTECIILLTQALHQVGQIDALGRFLQTHFDQIMLQCDIRTVRQIVTAGGTLTNDALLQLQDRAIGDGHPALATYIGNVLNVGDVQQYSREYCDGLWEQLSSDQTAEQMQTIRKIQLLFPEQYELHYAQLFPHLLRFELENAPPQEDERAFVLTQMLTPESIREDTLSAILEVLKESSMLCHESILERLEETCTTPALQEICMHFLHSHAETFAGKADRLLCRLYRNALHADTLPADFLETAEAVCLRQLKNHQDSVAVQCVCGIEELLDRPPYAGFARLYLQSIEAEIADAAPEAADGITELSLFRQVLEQPDADIGHYLRFCSYFSLFSKQEQEAVDELLNTKQEGALTEAESIPVLHGLYENRQDVRYLGAIARLPFRDNPRVYARLLYFGAYHSWARGITWGTCADYCEKFRLDDELIQVLLTWIRRGIRNPNKQVQWYDFKGCFNAISRLCSRPDGFPTLSRPEEVRELIEELCSFFIRIDANSTDSANHNSLRTIVELAVLSGQDDILTDRVMDKLLGIYKKLGLVFAFRLLLQRRFDRARSQFQALSRSYGLLTYKDLVVQLAQMDDDEMERWIQDEASQLLLKYFILPDGNRPAVQQLRTFVMACVTQKKQEPGIRVAEKLIDYFENDCICYKVLFILCKEEPLSHLPQLQRALAGLYIHFPVDRSSFYTRSRGEILKLLTVVSALMQRLGIPQCIENLGDFIHKSNVQDTRELNQVVGTHIKLYETVLGDFTGMTEPQSQLLAQGLLGSVTGNWTPMLLMGYQNGVPEHEMAGFFRRCGYCTWGLLRSILLAARSIDDEQTQSKFLEWIRKSAINSSNVPERIKNTMKPLSAFLGYNRINQLDMDFLRLPWEEHLVCIAESGDTNSAEPDSCYMWMWRHLRHLPQGCSAATTLQAYFRLAQDNFRTVILYNDCNKSFQRGEFALAAEIYDALGAIRAVPKDVRGLPEKDQQQIQRNYAEIYQSSSRICRIMLGDPEMVEKFRTMKIRSCSNIIVTLLQSRHAGKLASIAHYFTGVNRRLCRDYLKIVNLSVTDQEKLEIFRSYDAFLDAQIALSLALSTYRPDDAAYLFTQSAALGEQMRAFYVSQTNNMMKPKAFIPFTNPVSANVLNQVIDISSDENADDRSAAGENSASGTGTGPIDEEFLPAFALQAHSELQDQQIPSLETLQAQYERCAYDDYEQLFHCARGIYYLISKDNPPDSGETVAALLQFGQVYRNYHLSLLTGPGERTAEERQTSRSLARQALLDMACYCTRHSLRSIENAPTILFADGLQGILLDNFSTIDELLEDYRKNRTGYQALIQQISDNQIRFIVTNIFDIIQQLANHYEIGGPKDQNTASYRAAYKNAYDTLEQVPFDLTWNEAKNTLLKHIMQAINDLDKRPYLDVRILNDGQGARMDSITGILTNTGRVPAENITAQVIFGSGTVSDTYGYKELLPGEKICFAVNYTAPAEELTLPYRLNITYSYRDKEYIADPRTGTLEIRENEAMRPDTDLYGAHKQITFTTNAHGDVVGKGFYGREDEKMMLQNLAPEDAEFIDYHNAVIQGFRRTGKTSLLYYFMQHIRSKCGDRAIPIYVDCEGFKEQPIQKVFVSTVLLGLENELPNLIDQESWQRLKQSWTLPADAPDRDPDMLQFFYQALGRELDGIGIILIVDEIDRLFDRVEETMGTISSLLPSLRAIQNNPNCRKAIHLLFCGSNNMLIYNQDEGKLHQLFQNFATIRVGQLKKEDVQRLLTEPLEQFPGVEYHPEAIEWIWRYTGGLVWYTKLLGNAAVEQVKSKSRNRVYPMDVSVAFDSIINEKNCKQYIDEGCNEDDRLVLDAMATLATRFGADVTVSQLTALLDGALTESQLDRSLRLLTDTLHLLERSANNRNTYHFAVEIYRRFYRTLSSRFDRTEALADRMSITAFTPSASDAPGQRSYIKKRNT